MAPDPGPPDARTVAALVDALERASASVTEIVREHVDDNDEVLPTLLLADVGQWFVAAHASTGADEATEADRVVRALAESYENGDRAMQNMIATGFLEALPHPDQEGRNAVDRLPDPLRAKLTRMENA